MGGWLNGPANAYRALIATTGARLNTRASFRPTRYVWSRAIALLCDHNGGFSFVRKQRGGGRRRAPIRAGCVRGHPRRRTSYGFV